MNIGVISAAGRVGRLVVKEALQKGYQVTAIIRPEDDATGLDIEILRRDIYFITPEDLKPFDVIVVTFGVGADQAFQYETVMATLIHLMKALPEKRFIINGGAASLFTDETKTTRVLSTIPEAWAAVPLHAFKGFQLLEASGLANWTYFSPAAFFDWNGARTGEYKLGGDVQIFNSTGESYLSYPDFAVALVDEIANGKFLGRRFTAVSEHVGAPAPAPAATEAPKAEPAPAVEEPAEEKIPADVDFSGFISESEIIAQSTHQDANSVTDLDALETLEGEAQEAAEAIQEAVEAAPEEVAAQDEVPAEAPAEEAGLNQEDGVKPRSFFTKLFKKKN